jgi:triacylglycerol lipase
MIVRITRTLLVLQLLTATAIAMALMKTGRADNVGLAMLAGIGLIALLRLAIVANNFHLAWRFRSVTPPPHRLNRWQACKLFIGEFKASMVASSLTMPFCAFANRAADKPTGLPVLLIHGYGCNSGYWHSMSKALLQAGTSHRAIDMEPVTCGIDDYTAGIHRGIEMLCAETGSDRVVIVAHSMGGLATRAYLREHGMASIAKVVTLGTPHRGTGIAQFGLGVNCSQMRWSPEGEEGLSSEWLRTLANAESERSRSLFVSIYSHHDNIIAPQTSSQLSGAKNIELHGIGHVALASDHRVQALVIEEVRNASRQMGSITGAAQ